MTFDFEVQEQYLMRGERVSRDTLSSLKNWYPITIDRTSKQITWRDLAKTRFTESFFHTTLTNQPKEHQRLCTTELSAVAEFNSGITPSAFLFHVSRCGSTLITQMLSDLEHCIVLSEPPILDAFFRTHRNTSQTDITLFQQIIYSLGQQRFENERNFFIKFDSWHISHIDFIRDAFPDVPMIFLYRNPHQVLASHQRQRGPQMIPNFVDMVNLDIDQSDLAAGDFDTYSLRVLEQFFVNAITGRQRNKLTLLNYHQLPEFIWEKLLTMLQIDCSMEEIDRMQKRAQFHSKNPDQNFKQDPQGSAKPLDSTSCIALYDELESIRKIQG